ncbi:UNVERIFIED_CONTAM: hypothetical protein Sindi_1848800 [Sesamum indicum]
MTVHSDQGLMMFAFIVMKSGIGRRSTHNSSPTKPRAGKKQKATYGRDAPKGLVRARSYLRKLWDLST